MKHFACHASIGSRARMLAFVFSSLFWMGTGARAQNPVPDLQATESAAWQTWAKFDVPGFGALLAPEYTEMAPEGNQSRAEALATMTKFRDQRCTLAHYTLDDLHTHQLTKGATLAVYHFTGHLACGGQASAIDREMSDLWEHRSGKWKLLFHAECAATKR